MKQMDEKFFFEAGHEEVLFLKGLETEIVRFKLKMLARLKRLEKSRKKRGGQEVAS